MSGGIPLRARSGRKSRDRWSAGDARRARSPLMQEVEAQPEVGRLVLQAPVTFPASGTAPIGRRS